MKNKINMDCCDGPRSKSLRVSRCAPPLQFRWAEPNFNNLCCFVVLQVMVVHVAVVFASLPGPTLPMRAAIKGGPALTLQHVSLNSLPSNHLNSRLPASAAYR